MPIRLTLICFLTLLFSLPSNATHLMGGYIYYEALDSVRYKISFVFYRDCNALPMNSSGNSSLYCPQTSKTLNLSLSLDAINDITPYGPNTASGCSPQNTARTGEGIERHIYSTTVDFSQSPWNQFSGCCELIIRSSLCCRNSSINTGPGGNYFNYAVLNLCQAGSNSSGRLAFDPVNRFCCNQPAQMSFASSDAIDGDSLSYSWGEPLTSYGVASAYSGLYYAYNHPFQVYYPGSLTPPYANPNANPPIGLYLDPQTGNILFTPTRCDEVTVAVVEVKEWRDSSGQMIQVGKNRVEMQFTTTSCPSNNPPQLHLEDVYYVCPGDSLCFDIRTSDQPSIPPPPDTTLNYDSTFLSWDGNLSGAALQTVDTSRNQGGVFCWSPDSSDVRTEPYLVSFKVVDDVDPFQTVVTKTVKIFVPDTVSIQQTIVDLGCGRFRIDASVSPPLATGMIERQILDSTGTRTSSNALKDISEIYDLGNGSTSQIIDFASAGRYIIQTQACPSTLLDTIDVVQPFEIKLNHGDTTLCIGDSIRLQASYYPFANYQWFKNGDSIAGATQLHYWAKVTDYIADRYWVKADGIDSCSGAPIITISTHPDVTPIVQDTFFSCEDTAFVQLPPDKLDLIAWSNGQLGQYAYYTSSGPKFVVSWDENGCRESQDFHVITNYKPELELKDTSMCLPSFYLEPGYPGSYLWHNGSRNTGIYLTQSDTVSLRIMRNGCTARDTAIIILDESIQISSRDTTVCHTDGQLNLSQLLDTVNLADGITQWTCLDCNGAPTNTMVYNTGGNGLGAELHFTPSLYVPQGDIDTILLELRNWKSASCIAYDTLAIRIVKQPTAPVLTKETSYRIRSSVSPVKWFVDGTEIVDETGATLSISAIGNYTARYVDSFGCSSEFSNIIQKTATLEPIHETMLNRYPVPASNRLYIDIRPAEIEQIQMVNELGQRVDFEQLSGEKVELTFELPDGIYYIHIQTSERSFQLPFTVLKQ